MVNAIWAFAQTDRITKLQGARTLVVTDSEGQKDSYQVTTDKSFVIHLQDGKLLFGNKAMSLDAIEKMRLETPQKFLLNEDSTTFTAYDVDGGLLALRRDFLLNKWNSLVLPVSLTGQHVIDAFGEDAQLATLNDIIETEQEAQVNFRTIDINTDDEVITPGVHYLIRPTREPDIALGKTSTVNYGTARVPGPAYLVEGATMVASNKSPQYKTIRSDQDHVRLRHTGTYIRREGRQQPINVYAFNTEGNMTWHTDSVAAKGFTSWLMLARNTNQTDIHFYVDGISLNGDLTGIINVKSKKQTSGEKAYDLQGRQVSDLKRGLYIVNGKKVYVR